MVILIEYLQEHPLEDNPTFFFQLQIPEMEFLRGRKMSEFHPSGGGSGKERETYNSTFDEEDPPFTFTLSCFILQS